MEKPTKKRGRQPLQPGVKALPITVFVPASAQQKFITLFGEYNEVLVKEYFKTACSRFLSENDFTEKF